jgi:hypothetical protein
MSDIVNDSDVIGFNISYNMSTKIHCDNLPAISNISFIKSDDNKHVIGFNIEILTSEIDEALRKSQLIANKIVGFITLETAQFVSATQTGYGGIPKKGKTARVSKTLILRWNIKGIEPVLELKPESFSNALEIDESHLGLLQKYSKAILHYNSGFPEESIKELFAIIEYDNSFQDYYKYYSLRQVLTHNPNFTKGKAYNKKTIENFNNYFDKNSFDYLKYDPTNFIIVIDLNSKASQVCLSQIASDFKDALRLHLLGKFGLPNKS